jgi:hypothetical protein
MMIDSLNNPVAIRIGRGALGNSRRKQICDNTLTLAAHPREFHMRRVRHGDRALSIVHRALIFASHRRRVRRAIAKAPLATEA